MRTREVARVVRTILDRLPKDPNKIAGVLKQRRIRGRRYDSGSNPLVALVERQLASKLGRSLAQQYKISIAPGAFWVRSSNTAHTESRVTPTNVQAFINRFNGGSFPAIVR